MYYNNRRRELWHETARLALEKGQPLPALPTDDEPHRRRPEDRGNDIRIGVGLGLYLFLSSLVGRSLGYVGAIPGFIGVALLLYGLFSALTRRKHSDRDSLPPRS